MKKLFKSLAIAGLATGALLSTAGLASAQQTASLTVVIDKIELMTNGDAIPVTVYQPSAGIAATATTTIDLFNASQKLGVRLPIAAPQAGTYNTMLVTFSTLAVGNSQTVSRSLVTDLQSARQLGTDAQGRGVIVFGDCGTASGGAAGLGFGVCADLRPGAAGADIASSGVIQPIVSTGLNTSINLPSLNFFLPRSEVTISGTSVIVNDTPRPIAIASEAIDNARRPNVIIGVKPIALAVSQTAASFPARVGLFACASGSDCAVGVTNKRPMFSRAVTLVSPSASVSWSTVTEVTFIDVPDGHYFPVAWRDANNNGLWDDGERTALVSANTQSANSILSVVSGTLGTGTYQMDAVSASTISSTRVLAGSTNELGGSGNNGFVGEANSNQYITLAPRAVSLTFDLASAPDAEIQQGQAQSMTAGNASNGGILPAAQAGGFRVTNNTGGALTSSGTAPIVASLTIAVSLSDVLSKTIFNNIPAELLTDSTNLTFANGATVGAAAVSATAVAPVSGSLATVTSATNVLTFRTLVPLVRITTIGNTDNAVNKGNAGTVGINTRMTQVNKSGTAQGTGSSTPLQTTVTLADSDNSVKAAGTLQNILP